MATAAEDPGLIRRVVIGAVVLGVGLLVVSQVVTVGDLTSVDGSIRVGGDGVVVLQHNDDVTEVRDSTGRAADLSGGQVAISGGLGVRDDADNRWTFGTYAAVDNASQPGVLFSLGDEIVVAYVPDNGGEFVAWYYNGSSTNSYTVAVPVNSPTTLSPVLLEQDGDTLTLSNEAGTSASVTLTPSTESTAPLPTSDRLNGRLDETRSWDRALTSGEKSTYRADGIEPVAVGNRSARLLYDKAGDDVAVEFTSSNGELRGSASRGDGLAGTVMTRGTDFVIDVVGGDEAVRVVDGGALEDQPRIAISTPPSPFEEFVRAIGAAFALAGVVFIVAIARRILAVVNTS